jgi:hypothetical protein
MSVNISREELEARYPHNDFRYVRDTYTGKFYNFFRNTWHDDRAMATPLSPDAIRLVKSGKSKLGRQYPIADLEFVPFDR